jgi:type IV pilus assembly protein PilC
MPKFSYIASTVKGDSIRGSVQANNKAEVAKILSQQGLFMTSCKIEDVVEVSPHLVPVRSSGNSYPSPSAQSLQSNTVAKPAFHQGWSAFLTHEKGTNPNKKPKGDVPLKELVVLTRQLSISINAGMSFVDALQGMAQNNKNVLLAWTLRHVLDDVLSGKKFSEALSQHPEIFQTFYVSMAAAGEAGGFMPDALNRIAEFLEKEMELRGKIKSAMIYPIVIGSVATVVVIGMMAYIVPTFVKVFQEMGAPLPLPTKMLIYASDFTRKGGFLLPLAFIALHMLLKRLRARNETIRAFYDQHILSVPLFGKIMVLEIITRFIRTLASLADNGVAILLSLSVARQVIGNRTIEKVVDEIYSSVQQGNGISPVLYKSAYFPVLVANMVATGEKTGSIPEVLLKMANYYDAEVAAAVRDLLTLMEPLLIVVMAVIVGFVVAGLMLPTFQMSQLVQG